MLCRLEPIDGAWELFTIRNWTTGMSEEPTEFFQQGVDDQLHDDLRQLVRLAVREDLDAGMDVTSLALVPVDSQGEASLVARQDGVAAGVALIPTILDEVDAALDYRPAVEDGHRLAAGQKLASLAGNTRDLLTTERIILNFLGRMCGIASWTRLFVDQLAGSRVRLFDTRKTIPGWRRLEKYATRCGGAWNHRQGLFDAILIKDNHLASQAGPDGQAMNPGEAVHMARAFQQQLALEGRPIGVIEIEVDTLDQLQAALLAHPGVILLDNMSLEQLREAVQLRNRLAPQVQLEASGSVTLTRLPQIAHTGVDRISCGALTHSAIQLDVGLDWLIRPGLPPAAAGQ
jgi:nicotinate-nucleotide pyrophosphorylase (carboxylating)